MIMPKLQSKLPSTGTSIFAVMSKLANDHKAINLSQGFPDFNCSDELIEIVNKYSRMGFNQYAPMPGLLSLREAISNKVFDFYNRRYNPDTEINITSGATQALFTAISCLIQPGDEVILFEPAYDSYAPVIELNKGIPVFLPLIGDEFRIDWNAVRDNINENTKCIIVNSPHNPTGSLIDEQDLRNLEELTRDKNIFIISDEVYEHIIFDGHKHISIASSEELSKKAFVISSFGKTFHTTGWKVGYCCAPEYMMAEFRKVHQFVVFAVNTPVQQAYSEFMLDNERFTSLNGFYQQKRDLLIRSLHGSRFSLIPAKGTYFQLLNYSEISGKNDFEFSIELVKNSGVAVIPLTPFCKNESSKKLIRLCFAKRNEVLIEAAEKLKSLCL